MLPRRRMLSLLAVSPAAASCGGSPPADQATTRTRPALRGADLSFTLREEARGATFRDRGRIAPVERLLADRGANVVRLRVWVDAAAGHSDLGSALVLARRARDAGMRVLLDLHYSDTWADKASQRTPAAWAGQNLPVLAETVRTYTRECVRAFAAQHTPIDLIQIGNEITSGMLWPTGQIYRDGREHWADFVALLRAGLRGAREGGSAALRTVVHIDRGGDNGGARYFYDHVVGDDDIDVVALSYYPFWHGPLAVLQANLDDLATRYGKDVLVVETSYPWNIPDSDTGEYFAGRTEQLPEAERFPPSPAGQAAYFEALRAVLQQVPEGRGLGFLAWEPAWLPGSGWTDGESSNPYGNLTMFDWQGMGLPSLDAFRP